MYIQRKPIPAEVSGEELKAHLESYQQKALELGASAAEVIPASLVSVDERVRCVIRRLIRLLFSVPFQWVSCLFTELGPSKPKVLDGYC